MGCKPSTLGAYQRGSSNAAGAAAVPSVAVPVENDSFIDAAAPAAAAEPAAEIPPSGALGGCEGSSSNSKNNDSSNSGKLPGLRLRLVSLKPELKTFSSPRQSIASGYEKIKRGASSLKAAITPRTATPGLLSPREADALGAPGGPHCIASDAIKEADSAACLDVAETKGQAVCGPLHTAIDAAAAERKAEESKDSSNKDAYQIPHTELINKETPSPQQLKSLWMLMKISGASSPQEAMQWLHDLEVVLVTLDPVERQQPTRSILLEAKALEICLRPLSQTPDEVQLCVSSLAIIVHLCMAKEASERLLELGGIEVTAKVLKKYFSKAKKLQKDIPLMHVLQDAPAADNQQQQEQQQQQQEQSWTDVQEPPTPAPTPEAVLNSNCNGGPATPQQQPILKGAAAVEEAVHTPQDAAAAAAPEAAAAPASADAPLPTPTPANTPEEHAAATPAAEDAAATEAAPAAGAGEAAPAPAAPAAATEAAPAPAAGAANASPEPTTKPQGNGQMAAFKRACSKLQQQLPMLLQQKLGTAPEVINVTREQYEAAIKELRLLAEFMTLVWRLVFATSLDGDEFAQRWASCGVPELAIEALSCSEGVYKESSFVCWSLGALRFIPLAVPSVAEVYVHSKGLLAAAYDRMLLHYTDPLVLENGFALLANYQRKQPSNSQLFSKQRPEAWGKCVSWLLQEESLSRVDVLFQGLFSLGLACSYCPAAAKRVREAGGLILTEKVLGAGAQLGRDTSTSSTVESKITTLQQFAEGLQSLLLRSEEAEATAAAAEAADNAEAAADNAAAAPSADSPAPAAGTPPAEAAEAAAAAAAAPAADGAAAEAAPAAADTAAHSKEDVPATEAAAAAAEASANVESSKEAAAAADDTQANATREYILQAEEKTSKEAAKENKETPEETPEQTTTKGDNQQQDSSNAADETNKQTATQNNTEETN